MSGLVYCAEYLQIHTKPQKQEITKFIKFFCTQPLAITMITCISTLGNLSSIPRINRHTSDLQLYTATNMDQEQTSLARKCGNILSLSIFGVKESVHPLWE